MTKFKVGDKVRIIKDMGGLAGVKIGTVAAVIEVDSDGDVRVDVINKNGIPAFFIADEVELVPQKPTKNQRISELERKVAELTAKVEALESAQNPTENFAKNRADFTPNEERKAIIAEAKAFVEKYEAVRAGEANKAKEGTSTARMHYYETEFAVKDSKVTAVIYRLSLGRKRQGKPSEIGRSKCAPDDVFNVDIGKAIALGRALGLDVKRFEQAVKPTEVVAGMLVENTGNAGGTYKIVKVDGDDLDIDFEGRYFERKYGVIVDDTEAKY